MNAQEIWQIIEPWVSVILSAVSAVITICITVKARLKKWNFSFMKQYDANDMALRVAENIAGKTMNIDVTAISERKLDKIENKLHKQVEQIRDEVSALKRILIPIGAAMAHFKSLTDDERLTLQNAVKVLDSGYEPPEPEQVITVKLEPIATDEPSETEETDSAEMESLINFGGMTQ